MFCGWQAGREKRRASDFWVNRAQYKTNGQYCKNPCGMDTVKPACCHHGLKCSFFGPEYATFSGNLAFSALYVSGPMPQCRERAAGGFHRAVLKVEMGARAIVSVASFQWCLLSASAACVQSSQTVLFHPDPPVLAETTSINECNDFSISYSNSWTNA